MKHKARVLAIGLTIVVVAAIAFIVVNRPFEKVYGEAAGHKIYKSEVDAMQKSSPQISTSKIVSVLLDKYFLGRLIADNHVTVSQQDIQFQIKAEAGRDTGQVASYISQDATNLVYTNELKRALIDHYAGKFIIAHFDQRIPYYKSDGTAITGASPGAGDPVLMAADRQYATDFINSTYQQISSGKITFEAGMQRELNDPKIGQKALDGLSHSGNFDLTSTQEASEGQSALNEAIKSLKLHQVSKPFVVQESAGSKMVDAYWLIMRLDDTRNDHINYDQYVAAAKQRLGYKKYV